MASSAVAMTSGDGSGSSPSPAFSHWHSPYGSGVTPQAEVKPDFGMLTWREEGRESTKNNSRWLHVPGKWSGCTIGRGSDMKQVAGGAGAIEADLAAAMSADGKPADIANIHALAQACSGKSGEQAKQAAAAFSSFELTPTAQKILFERTYKKKQIYASGVYARALEKKALDGQTFEGMNPAIREVAVDLTYVGQFTPRKHEDLLKAMAANDVQAFRDAVDKLPKKGYEHRYKSRLKVLDQEIERQKQESQPLALGTTASVAPALRNRGQIVNKA